MEEKLKEFYIKHDAQIWVAIVLVAILIYAFSGGDGSTGGSYLQEACPDCGNW